MKKNNQHRTIYGSMVDPLSQECLEDLNIRIEDATFNRDCCPHGTANRTHYNGLLSLLRKHRKKILKHIKFSEALNETDVDLNVSQGTSRTNRVQNAATKKGNKMVAVASKADVPSYSFETDNKKAEKINECFEVPSLWDKILKC